MLRRRFGRLCLVALAAGAGLAACSNSAKPSTSATTKPTTTTTKPSTTHETVVPINVPNQDNVRKDVAMLSCAASKGGWAAGGAVKNSQGKTETYDITVFFTSAHSTDLAYATTNVTVDPNKSVLWSAKATFAAPTGVLCVLRGVSVS